MPRYAITERAGPFVAAHRNTGVGTVLDLTERQAEHELRLGTLIALTEPDQIAADRADVAPATELAAPLQPTTAPLSQSEIETPAPARKLKRSAP